MNRSAEGGPVVGVGARRAGIVAVVLASEGAIGAFHQLMTSALEDGQHGCQTSDGLATWDTTRAGLSDSAVSG